VKSKAIQFYVDDENEAQLGWFCQLVEQEFRRRFKRSPHEVQIHEVNISESGDGT